MGMSKKDQNGRYINGYMLVKFKKDIELDNMTKINVKENWVDFYKKDTQTIPYIFIADFEIVKDEVEQISAKTDFDKNGQIDIRPEDMPF